MEDKPAVARRNKVQSAGMGMEVLKKLAALGGGASLTALAQALDESPAKIHRYLASLVEAELVEQDPETARYVLGLQAIEIGLAAIHQSDTLTLATAELALLAERHQLSSFVAVLGNRGPTIVRWDEPIRPVTVNVRVGSVMPVLWSATGRAFAAFSKAALLDALVRAELAEASPAQKRLLPSRRAVDALLAEIRALGCCCIADVLLTGVSAVAAPIFDVNGKVAAVLTSLGPSGEFDAAPGGAIATLIRDSAAAISFRRGYRAPSA